MVRAIRNTIRDQELREILDRILKRVGARGGLPVVKRVVVFDPIEEEKKARYPDKRVREFCLKCRGYTGLPNSYSG